MTKSERIYIRVTPEESEHWKNQAKEENFETVSEYIRFLLRREWRRIIDRRNKTR